MKDVTDDELGSFQSSIKENRRYFSSFKKIRDKIMELTYIALLQLRKVSSH
jgi:hypothetical protein